MILNDKAVFLNGFPLSPFSGPLHLMFKFFPAELWQVDSNGTPQGL